MKAEIRKQIFKLQVANAVIVENELNGTDHEIIFDWLDEVKQDFLETIKEESE